MNVALSLPPYVVIDTHRARQNSRAWISNSFFHALRPTKTEGLLEFSLHNELGSLVVANEPLI